MSEVQKQPQVPDTMPYTDDDRALARAKQQEVLDAKKRKRNRVVASIAGGAVLLAGGAVAGMRLTGGSDAAPIKERNPAASASPTPGEAEPQAQTGEFGISAAEFDGNPEMIAQEFYTQQNEYLIAGADEKAANADERFQVTNEEYVASLSAPIDEAFVESMFVDSWESNPKLAEYVTAIEQIANVTRRVRLETYSGGTEDKEPYVRETIVDELMTSVKPLTTSVRWHEQDNRDMNTAEEVLTGVDPNDQVGGETFTWVNVDGQMKISDIAHYDGQ